MANRIANIFLVLERRSYFTLCKFFTSVVAFPWIQSDSKSLQVSSTFPSILIITVLWYRWSPFLLQSVVLQVSCLCLWGSFQGHQLQLVSLFQWFWGLWQDYSSFFLNPPLHPPPSSSSSSSCYYHYYSTPIEISTPALTDGLSLDSKWQQVSSGHYDSFEYSSWSQQCCGLCGLDSSSEFPLAPLVFHTTSNQLSSLNFEWQQISRGLQDNFRILANFISDVVWTGPISSWIISSFCLFLWFFRIIINIIILHFWEFFTPALADSLPLEFEWQQISSSLPDSFQQCYSLNRLYWPSYFQVLQSLYQSFSDCTERSNYNWYHRHFHVP